MQQTFPFPPLPDWLPIEPAYRPATLRPFGSDPRDLTVEFAGAQTPGLVTSLLSRCAQTPGGDSPPEQAIWDLPLGTRIEAVMALAAGDAGRPLVWQVRCGHPSCGADGELELQPSELTNFAREACRLERVPVQLGNRSVWLRRPTGADQRRWLIARGQDVAPIAADIFVEPSFEALRAEGIDLEAIGDSVDRAMDVHDPLVGFHLEVVCAECGRPTVHAPDLLAAALERLWLAQFDLMEQVHRLASRYHWSEEEIAKLPDWRRQAYLAYIEGEQA